MYLSTGREIYDDFCSGCISLDANGVVCVGYDNELTSLTEDLGDEPTLTPEERKELAQIVIDRWRKWAGL